MDFVLALRQATKKVLEQYERIWLEEFPVAWSNTYGQSHAQLQAAALKAGYKDYVDLLRNCSTFCQFEMLPEQAQRPLVRFTDPTVKVELLAAQLREESCQRYEHVSVSDIMDEISRRFNVSSFAQLDVPVSAVKTLQELTELESTTYNYISAFIGIRHTSTLFDLEQHLCAALRVSNFDQLHVGPLLRHPSVQQAFQPPPHLHEILEVSLSHVINAVEHLLTPKNPQVQAHAILQYLTREFDVSMPQDLCVRITSPESLVQLVKQIHLEENNAKKAVRELKVHEAMKQAEKIPVTRAELSLAALREMNQADGQSTDARHDASLAERGFKSNPPPYIKVSTVLNSSKRKGEQPLPDDWPGLEASLDTACAKLQDICQHKPNVFSLSLLAQALCTSGKLTQQDDSRRITKWADFWRYDVLAGLLLRAKAESLYEHSYADRLPNSLTVKLSDTATAQCASLLHLQQNEVSWAAVYVHFLDHAKAYLQTHKASPVNVFAMGHHLTKLFYPRSSQQATSPMPKGSPQSLGSPQGSPSPGSGSHEHFWTHDALAAYLLASLIKLLGREPVYPGMPEKILPNETSVMVKPGVERSLVLSPNSAGLRHTTKQPRPDMHATAQATELQADAQSAQPHDSHWLLTEATAALQHLAGQLETYTKQGADAALAAVERLTLQMLEQQPEVLRFLGEVASIGSATASFTRLMEALPDSPAENDTKPASHSLSPAGRSFRPVSSQQIYQAVAELCKGSSPSQLASLELELQQQFKAPSFAALGHGSSLLQLCGQDEQVMKIITSAGQSLAPLAQVMLVIQQAMQAAAVDPTDNTQAVSVGKVVEGCLRTHFRVASSASLGHGTLADLMSMAQQQQAAATTSVYSAAALAAVRGGQSNSGSLYTGQLANVTAATQALQKAPTLSDLAAWTSWELLFEQELGRLPDFLQQTGGLQALQLPSQALLRLPEHASLDSFSSALSQGNATAVVGSMLSIMTDHQGVQHAPLAMLASHCQAHLSVLASSAEGSRLEEGSSKAAGLSKAASFVLDCLAQLPHPLLAVLGQPVLLQPLIEVAQSAALAENSLLQAATLYAQRAVLHKLGFMLGITKWQDDWHKMMLPAAAPRAPSNPQSAIASLPSSASTSASALADQASIQTLLSQLLSRNNAGTAADSSKAPATQQASREAVSLMQTKKLSRPMSTPVPASGSRAASVEPVVIDLVEEENEAKSQRCEAVVENIRREEFGVGLVLDAAGSQLRQRQNERIGRALQRLSQELYSKDTHFVLELVQNADDNVYDAGVLPALEFVLQGSGIAVLNNEVGFSEQNIRALCDVGRTTKKHFLGYIGQKGIGFKSVFKVTDAPQIHSNGFHVVFDLLRHSSLGYVLPTWVKAPPAITNSKLAPQATTTRMLLPFKQGEQQQSSVLRQRFDDVQPTLLLFLQRLQCIIINDAVNGNTSIMVRRPLGGGLVELRHGPQAEHVARYLQVSHTFQPSVPRLDVQLDQTTVSLAFNLEGDVPTQQQVYAFLPLRSYGLSFIVQADFIVPSSREAVDCDSAWNEVLREQVPSLFLQALHSFRQLPAPDTSTPMAWVNRWLQSIPLPREAQSFFAALPQRLAARLQQAPCIPTEGHQWVYPQDALVCQNPQVRNLLANPSLSGVMTLQYAHSGLTILHSSKPLQKLLGVGEVAHGHLMEVVRQLHGKGDSKGGMLVQMGTPWLAKLLLCVFESLAQEHSTVVGYEASSSAVATAMGKAVVAELRQLFPLLLADGTLAAVDNDSKEPVYFPMDLPSIQGREAGTAQSSLTEKQRELLARCQLPLRLMDATFLEAAGADRQSAMIHALETLGVQHLQVTNIITDHLLPALNKCNSSTHIAFLSLIIDSGLTSPQASNQELADSIVTSLKSHGQVVTNHGYIPLAGSFLHLPAALGNKIDLARLFPKHRWHFPSEEYLATGVGTPSAWRHLWMSLGFTDFIQTPAQTILLSPAEKAESVWAHADLGHADKHGKFAVQDWSASEFTGLLDSLQDQCTHHDELASQCSQLLRQLDILWEEQYASCCTASLASPGIEPASATATQSLPSSFLHALKTSAWLPSTRGTVQQPGSLFMPDRETQALLGDHVPYLKCSIKDPDLISALGVTTEVTWEILLQLLTTWAKSTVFKTSLEQMSNLYSFLGAAVESDPEAAEAICSAFQKLPLVWLPSKDACEHSMQSVRSIRSMLSSVVSKAGTPFRPGLVSYDITPTPISALGRKSRRKVSFMTPGTGSRRFGMAGLPHTPHTPSLGTDMSAQQVEGCFYAASGDHVRLYDTTGVIEGILNDKADIRILSEHYTSPAVMQFFAHDLVKSTPITASTQQPVSMGLHTQSSTIQAEAAHVPPQEQHTATQQPVEHLQRSTAQETLPQQQQPQSPVQDASEQLQQQQAAAVPKSPSALQIYLAGTQQQQQPAQGSGRIARTRLEEYIDLRSDTDTDMDLSQPSPAKPSTAGAASGISHTAGGLPSPQAVSANAPHVIASTAQPLQSAPAPSAVSSPQQTGQPTDQAATAASSGGPIFTAAAAADAHGHLQSDTGMMGAPAARPPSLAQSPSAASGEPQTSHSGLPSPAESAKAPELLIQAEPSCQEYCQALQAIAAPVAPAYYAVQLTKVLAILNRWSHLIADSSMAQQEVQQLKRQLQDIPAFPVAGQQWACLADGPMVNDDASLAQLFEGIKGVVLLSLPADPERSDRAISLEDLQPLLTALEVPALSNTVQQSVPQLQGFSGSQELDPIIADCVLAVQRYLLHRHPEQYHALDSSVMSRLLSLRCVIVDELQVVYRLPTATGITVSQPQRQAAALQESDLYVEVERLDSYTHILPELTRLFNSGVKDSDMAQFLIALILTMMSRQDPEVFMQQEGCPALPDDVPEWQTPHLARALEEADAELSEEGELAMEENSLFLVRPKREHSPSDPADEPSIKKQRVEEHYTPLLDPSSRRVDYLDLATPRSALHSTLKRPRRTAPLDEDGQPSAIPLQRAGSTGTPLPDPPQVAARPRMLFQPEAQRAQQAPPAVAQQHPGFSAAAYPHVQHPQQQQYQVSRMSFDSRNNRPKTKAQWAAVQENRRKGGPDKAGPGKKWTVSSMQDLFDALYPYNGRPWVLEDVGVRAPADWRTVPALAVRAPMHLPIDIRDKPRPALEGKAPQVSQSDTNQQTGRWGEELVFNYLQWQLAAFHPVQGMHTDLAFICPTTSWLVEWINQKEETRKPFDIRLRDPHGNDIFIEVKASALRGRNIFQFSIQELKFAEAQSNNLHVYRVSGIGSANPTLTRLINPVQLSKLKLISLCLQM